MKRFPGYPSYLDSGNEWMGDIPAHWRKDRIGNLFFERNKRVSDKEYMALSVTMSGIVPQIKTVAKTAAGDDRKLVCKGDFVINSRSDRRGSSGVSKFDGSVSLISTVLKPKGLVPGYAHYLLRSFSFQEEFYRFGSGIVADLWSTNYSSMKNILIPVPPDNEQKLIHNYLEYEYDQLTLVRNAHASLKSFLNEKKYAVVSKGLSYTAEMKRSSIEWLDDVPCHWREVKAKYLFKELNRAIRPADDIVTVFRDGQVCLRHRRRSTGYTMAILEHGYQGIRAGDLVLHSMDAFAGAIGVAEDDGRATPEYVVVKPFDEKFNSHYFSEILRLMADRNYIFVICPSVRERAPRFRFSKFAEVVLPVPPVDEQESIAKYLAEYQALTIASERLVALREKRFKLLANDVVLGKIDVRNWQPPTASNAQPIKEATS